jgi:ABC-type multidrug transport system ATPase subunit
VPAGEALLQLRGVAKGWNGRRVLEDVDMDVSRGRFIRILGANGAGKTTLLRIASGLIRPDLGTVALSDLDPERQRSAFLARLGFLSAGDGGLYPRLSPRRHLELWADLAMVPPSERRAVVEDALDGFGLTPYADRRVQRTSTGQRQRTRLALTFLHRPDVVLLDEPLTSLDDDGIAILLHQLHEHRRRGGAAVWCAPSAGDHGLPFDDRYVLADARLRHE